MPDTSKSKISLLASLLLTFSLTNPLHADSSPQAYMLAYNKPVTLEQAVDKTKRETGGRILTAETIDKDGRRVHRLKVLLPGGSVKIIYVESN